MALQDLTSEDRSNLNLAGIQGDILIGLQKDAEVFVFFQIAAGEQAVDLFKAVLRSIRPLVISSKTVLDREKEIKAMKASGSIERLPLYALNIGFTHTGLKVLLGEDYDDEAVGLDESFKAGAFDRAEDLNDDTGKWLPAFTDDIHGVLLVTGPDLPTTREHAEAIVEKLGKSIVDPPHIEIGKTRPQRGHEHFGFLDGVSQPGIRGLTEPENPVDPEQGLPGQDLIHPGEFVFGYPGQTAGPNDTKKTIGPDSLPPLPWMRDGSYMVFRRLNQLVPEFKDFVDTEAGLLGMDPELLAARMVGRWPSGAPVSLAPLQDDPALGADKMLNNNFDFQADDQRRCPYAAHIRKTYPRDDIPGGEASIQTRRLRRAGIPFGDEVGADEKDAQTSDPLRPRGLMFVCYQTSIVEQFEFVQISWANNPNFVFGKNHPADAAGVQPGPGVTPGEDPIVGLSGAQRTMEEPIPNYPTGNVRSTLTLPEHFVEASGAAYFFMPSLDQLASGPLVDRDIGMAVEESALTEA